IVRFQRKSSQFLCFPTSQLIAELQTSVCDSKEEAVRLQQAMEKQLKEVNARWDEERQTITQNAEQANKALLEKVENLQRQLHCAEKKLLSKELESEERVTKVHQEYEEKIKGLMPADLRQELEDTITYLKAQVGFLQKTASLLQEDLDACRNRR
ncbi:PREDICTED: centrosomal protein of 112 kDa-like, partial [Cyprinodon variegatus]|uniref:centrosomal protein of 112 kDa-like n=1 Tax=Cyprinodon variegatus TaxID=28743 RepID=UPI00074297DD